MRSVSGRVKSDLGGPGMHKPGVLMRRKMSRHAGGSETEAPSLQLRLERFRALTTRSATAVTARRSLCQAKKLNDRLVPGLPRQVAVVERSPRTAKRSSMPSRSKIGFRGTAAALSDPKAPAAAGRSRDVLV